MKYLSLALILFLTSCRGIPPAKYIDVERCFPNMVQEVVIDEIPYYSGYCSCHTYRVGNALGRISETIKKPLLYCDKQAGFKDYATTLYLYLESWRIYLIQQSQK